VPPHRFLQEFKGYTLVSALCHKAFQNFSFVVDCTPQVVAFTINFHEDFVQMLLPPREWSKMVNSSFSDFGSELRAKSVPPKAGGFVANLDTTFMQKIFHVSERQRKPDVEHRR